MIHRRAEKSFRFVAIRAVIVLFLVVGVLVALRVQDLIPQEHDAPIEVVQEIARNGALPNVVQPS